jgi:hypothetical protein
MGQKVTVIVNKNNSDYVNWQTDLMYDSFLKCHGDDHNFEFMAVVIDDNKPVVCNYPNYICSIQSKATIVPGDDYIIFDRAYSIKNFLEGTKEESERLFLFVEADFLFARPFEVPNKKVVAQKYWYMDESYDFCRKCLKYYAEKINPSFIDFRQYYRPIGWPILIWEGTLRSIVNRWIELNIKFRSEDPESNPLYKNWICDMFGFNIALAENKIIPEVMEIMSMPPFGSNKNAVFYHYCYDIKNPKTGQVLFDKRSYKPWSQIQIPEGISEDSIGLINLINQYASTKNV